MSTTNEVEGEGEDARRGITALVPSDGDLLRPSNSALSLTGELATNGYVHIPKVISAQAIADAVSEIQTAFATEKKESKGTYSRINRCMPC